MMYSFSGERQIQPYISELIISDGRFNAIDIEIFGRVAFARPGKNGGVQRMVGHWYDLNGNIGRLFALLDMRKVADIKGIPFQPIHLSEVPIHPKYFDADMGEVSFHRLNS